MHTAGRERAGVASESVTARSFSEIFRYKNTPTRDNPQLPLSRAPHTPSPTFGLSSLDRHTGCVTLNPSQVCHRVTLRCFYCWCAYVETGQMVKQKRADWQAIFYFVDTASRLDGFDFWCMHDEGPEKPSDSITLCYCRQRRTHTMRRALGRPSSARPDPSRRPVGT